jgi:alpha-mannosidase
MIEAYAGHGPRVATVGPLPQGRESVPEPPATQAVVGASTYGIWEEDVYQLWLDVEALFGLRENLEPESLRVDEIDRRCATVGADDFERPTTRCGDGAAARERLKPRCWNAHWHLSAAHVRFGHCTST